MMNSRFRGINDQCANSNDDVSTVVAIVHSNGRGSMKRAREERIQRWPLKKGALGYRLSKCGDQNGCVG
jgi:hypothetical protein